MKIPMERIEENAQAAMYKKLAGMNPGGEVNRVLSMDSWINSEMQEPEKALTGTAEEQERTKAAVIKDFLEKGTNDCRDIIGSLADEPETRSLRKAQQFIMEIMLKRRTPELVRQAITDRLDSQFREVHASELKKIYRDLGHLSGLVARIDIYDSCDSASSAWRSQNLAPKYVYAIDRCQKKCGASKHCKKLHAQLIKSLSDVPVYERVQTIRGIRDAGLIDSHLAARCEEMEKHIPFHGIAVAQGQLKLSSLSPAGDTPMPSLDLLKQATDEEVSTAATTCLIREGMTMAKIAAILKAKCYDGEAIRRIFGKAVTEVNKIKPEALHRCATTQYPFPANATIIPANMCSDCKHNNKELRFCSHHRRVLSTPLPEIEGNLPPEHVEFLQAFNSPNCVNTVTLDSPELYPPARPKSLQDIRLDEGWDLTSVLS